MQAHIDRLSTRLDDLVRLRELMASAMTDMQHVLHNIDVAARRAEEEAAGQESLPGIGGEKPKHVDPVMRDILSRIEDAEGALERGEGQLVLRCLRDIASWVVDL